MIILNLKNNRAYIGDGNYSLSFQSSDTITFTHKDCGDKMN